MRLFILSEVMFFSGFFDALFYNLFGGDVSSRLFGVQFLDPLGLPLLNTVLLVSSGVITTWAHVCVYSGFFVDMLVILSLLLRGLFIGVQYFEFSTSEFCIRSGIYGSCFFRLTGFHGLHVVVGSRLLLVTLFRGGSQVVRKYVRLDCSFVY
jgi:cytochrome c oxidase subunit 3